MRHGHAEVPIHTPTCPHPGTGASSLTPARHTDIISDIPEEDTVGTLFWLPAYRPEVLSPSNSLAFVFLISFGLPSGLKKKKKKKFTW